MNIKRSHISVALGLAITTVAAAGCSSSTGGDDSPTAKTRSYSGEAVTLTLGTDDSPGVPSADQISHFADQVARLSDGKITIEPQWHAEGNDHPTDWDQAVAEMVRDGGLDLALGPTWAWDVLGVRTLQPLQAPFLVDSDPLVAAIVEDEALTGRLMSGLEDAGVTGLAMWPEGLRHPFGFEGPLTSPADYSGEVIRSPKSRTTAQVFEALGARTSAKEPNAETMVGVQSEFALNPNGVAAANITFFPKVNLLYANAETYADLDEDAARVLAEAAAATREWAIEQTDDVAAGKTFCDAGGTVVDAEEADIQALKELTAPVTDRIARRPDNKAAIAEITELKEGISSVRTAEPCSSEESQESDAHTPGPAEAALNGTYRFVITEQDFLDGGWTENDAYNNAGVQTYVLKNGEFHYRLDPSEREFNSSNVGPDETDGTYEVDGRNLTLRFPAFDNEVDLLTFEVADDGDLLMTAVDVDGYTELLLTGKPWDKIE